MPPKKTAAAAEPTGQNIKVLCAVLRGIDSLNVDWKSVAAELDIKRADNAGTAFRNAIKPLGLNYKAGKIFAIGDEAPAATPKKLVSNKKTKGNAKSTNSSGEESDEKSSGSDSSNKRKKDAEAGDGGNVGKKPKIEEDED
ncbi:uncharacterized protein AB675_1147 [Cyphellophora attinorum]|uniref:Uncharacterized protein n=1 Tax=Cyphellophora attinorum TaxID=1664694 RepID=A0A0N1H1H5_9EURO|nr:uncharacterized protein AB675_1147 [Phialophora attinorum]KPI38206.1 hypothetical protein AB675_1147 [Phialophora attinorum]